MNKAILISVALLLCGRVAVGGQNSALSIRNVRDPVQLRTILNANAADAEARLAGIESGDWKLSGLILTNGADNGTCSITVYADRSDDAGDITRLLFPATGGLKIQSDAGEQGALADILTFSKKGNTLVKGTLTVDGATRVATTLSGAVQATAGAITAGTLPVASGGTGLAAGTSGGIPYYSGTTAMTSSALLAQYGIVLGGGAGNPPATLAASANTGAPLLSAGSSANPAYGALNLAGGANIVTGTLPVGNGGSGATSLTGILKGNGTSAFSVAVAGQDYLSPAVAPNPASVVVSATNNTDGTAIVWIEVRDLTWNGMRSFADVWVAAGAYGAPASQDANLTVEAGNTAVLVQTVAANDHLRVLIPETGLASLTLTTAGTGHVVVAVGGVVHSAAFTVSGP